MELTRVLTTVRKEGCIGCFEWVDGALVDALENGDWVLLDNANLCNPTVLDRLSSLAEPNGVLHLNECGELDGKPRVVRPHSEFRLFLAYDPKHGEISRAMRNRSIETYFPSEVDTRSKSCHESNGTCVQISLAEKCDAAGTLASMPLLLQATLGNNDPSALEAFQTMFSSLVASQNEPIQSSDMRNLQRALSLYKLLLDYGRSPSDAVQTVSDQVTLSVF